MELYNDSCLTHTGSYYGLLYNLQNLHSLHLYEGASLFVTQSARTFAYGTLRIQSGLQLDERSTLEINRASGGPAIQFTSDGAHAIFNEPDRVKLYAPSKSLISFIYSGTLVINTDAVNIWQSSPGFTNDSFDNLPSNHWNKADHQLLKIDSSFRGTRQTLQSNLDSSDYTGNLNSTTFNPGNSQMLVFGNFELDINDVNENSTDLSGYSEPQAELEATRYPDGGLLAKGSAAGNEYCLEFLDTLTAEELIAVMSYHDYLHKLEITTVLPAANTLRFSYLPVMLDFGSISIPARAGIVRRRNNDAWYIGIEDRRRPSSPDWNLMVSMDAPLNTITGEGSFILQNALIFMDEQGNRTPLSDVLLLVASGHGDTDTRWNEDKGILLWADPGEILSASTYTTTLHWVLQDAP